MQRICLKCRKPFESRHKFNRICVPCSISNYACRWGVREMGKPVSLLAVDTNRMPRIDETGNR